MSNRFRSLLASTLGVLALASATFAGITDAVRVTRTHDDAWQAARVRLYFTTSTEDVVYVYVTLRITDEAALRLGEHESWIVEGRIYEGHGSNPSHRVWIGVTPETSYHDYPSLSGTVWANGSFTYANATFGHDGRVENGAPPALDDAGVDYTSIDEPVTLHFRDYAFDDNGAAPTSYKFGFFRKVFFGNAKQVAVGEFDHVDGETQSVTVEDGDAFSADGEEWFREGKTYYVVVRFRRTGSEHYSDEYGPRFLGQFTWNGSETVLEPLVAMDEEGLGPVERDLFQRLHGAVE